MVRDVTEGGVSLGDPVAQGRPLVGDGHGQPMTDAQQFEVFMQNYQNMVFSTAMRLVANQSDEAETVHYVYVTDDRDHLAEMVRVTSA